MRKFNDMSPITECFGNKRNPLIKVGVDRELSFYTTKREKMDAFRDRNDNDKFMIAWGGQWSTDVFEVSIDDIHEVLATL